MWPTLFQIGEGARAVPVHTWGLMLTLAFILAAGVTQRRAPKVGVEGDKLVGLYVVLLPAALVGARLLHFTMAEGRPLLSDPMSFFRAWEGGYAFYGGVVVATLSGMAYARIRGLPVWKLADLVAPSVMLGLAVGRLGCFMAGCCHGAACQVPHGAVNLLPEGFKGGALHAFPSSPFLAVENAASIGRNHLPLFPTQLWESVAALLLFIILSRILARRRYDGQVFAWMLLLYAPVRSLVEMFRGDVVRGVEWFGIFSTSQLVSIPLFVAGLALIITRRRRGVAVVTLPDDEAALLDELMEESGRR